MPRPIYAIAAALIALPLAAQDHTMTRKDLPPAVEASTLQGTRKGEFQVGTSGEKLSHSE